MLTSNQAKVKARRRKMLNPEELQELSHRCKANADHLIAQRLAKNKSKSARSDSCISNSKTANDNRRGRPPTQVQNPFFGFLGATSPHERYPRFSADIMEGVARLDWHDRAIGHGGSSKPLSVRSLMLILENLEVITSSEVGNLLELQARHSQRYVKAIELAMPYLMKSRPPSLIYEMDLQDDELVNAEHQRNRLDDAPVIESQAVTPTHEELAILRRDLGDDAFAPGYLINAAYYIETTVDIPTLCTEIAA